MNRTLESRLRRLEKDADMSNLRHLTDDELDQRILDNLRRMIAGHSSVMDAIAHFRGTNDPGYAEMADTLEEGLPMIRDVIARQYPAGA
ncbi:hypothetical protein [Methylobacterium frigidaeris]|uniref:Uncharacterized protein n=1 Tax=Methylobacterium frigidaeris TaxID=2038277 RepID=A0AA37M907_9HYPH|nr:hypothetical protein [Methylobacterium frigidaeris]PIK72278.1 hypothetical protein CS379_14825 [Methylobacterium frigidaeris]GJD66581.1 hypothetical protein MPEAHAMD_6779 [Methylobacterium frigidaeris]